MEANFTEVPQNNGQDQFGKQIVDALLHFLYRIVYFLFILPYGLWKNAVIRMSKQRQNNALDVTTIKTDYPFLSWFKRFLFEFLFDGLILISWVIGFISFIVFMVKMGSAFSYLGFWRSLWLILVSLYSAYCGPLLVTIIRDLTTICVVMPMRWVLSFWRRPAKTYDLTHTGVVKKD